jgi:hypothetical protein
MAKKLKTVREALDTGEAVKPLGSGVSDEPTATKALPGIDAANKGAAKFRADSERGAAKFKETQERGAAYYKAQQERGKYAK